MKQDQSGADNFLSVGHDAAVTQTTCSVLLLSHNSVNNTSDYKGIVRHGHLSLYDQHYSSTE